MLERTTAEKQRLRILTYTSLFPNQNQPRKGIFTWQRVSHLAKRQGNCFTVVAPLPYTPHWVPSRRLRFLATFPNWETIEQLTAYHPRYFLVPKIAMPLHGWLMFFGTMDLARRLHREMKFDCIDAHYVYPDAFCHHTAREAPKTTRHRPRPWDRHQPFPFIPQLAGRQYIAVAAGRSILAFALPQSDLRRNAETAVH